MSIKARVATGAVVLASASLLGFLAKWEGTSRTVYADKLAGGLPTACGGITKHTSPIPVVVGDEWPEEVCQDLLREVVAKDQLHLVDCLQGNVTQPIFDALSSHEHNFGGAATCKSEAVKAINAGRFKEGCLAISQTPSGKPNWSSHKTGKTLPDGRPEFEFVQGLYNRRKAETAMCLKGIP
jgi:GH24 family phage-related lysozyme (muramidase)